MTDSPMARVEIEIAKPRSVVRAQFFDVAHAIDVQLYRGMKLSWAPPPLPSDPDAKREASTARLVREEVTVLGQPIASDFTIGEGDGGAWVKRFVSGANAGARYVARFEASGDSSTRVALEAFAPPSGFNLGLGKLSALGLERALKKLLAEHQKALESYEFEPGSMRAPVASVLGSLGDLTLPLVKGAERALGSEGLAQRCERLGQRLKTLGHVELGLTLATIVAEVSHGIAPPELAALQKIALAAGLPEAALSSILARVDEEMGTT